MTQRTSLLYSKDHEWVEVDGAVGTVGISAYAQESLGDIVYVELPRVGATLQQFANIGVVESVKAVSDIFTPVGGEVLEINAALEGDPALVNREPFDGGWFYRIQLSDVSELQNLLAATAYEALITES